MLKKQVRAKFAINLDLSKKGKLEKFNLYDGETIIGSDKNKCDILLQGQDIAPIHCAINIFDDDLLISVHQDAKSGVYKRAELNKQKKVKLIEENIYSLKLEEDYWISNFKFNIVQYDSAYEEGDQKIQQQIFQQNEINNQQQLQATLLLNDDEEQNEENQIQNNQNFQETLQLSDEEEQISDAKQKDNNNNQQFQETLLLDEDDDENNDKNIQNKNNKMEIEPTLLVNEDCDSNDQNNADPTLIVDSDEDPQKNKIQQDNNLDPTLIDDSDEDQEQQQLKIKNNNNKMQIENPKNNNLEPTIVENTDSESDELKKIKNKQNNNLEATIIDDEQSDEGNNNDFQKLKKKLNIDQQNEETLVESSSDNDENKQQNNLQIQQKKSFFVRKNQIQDQKQIQKQEKDEGLSEIEKLRRKKEAQLQKEREEKRIKEEQEAKIFEEKKLEIEKRRKAMEDKIKAQFTAVSENNDIGDLFGEDDHTTSFVNQESRGNQLMKSYVANSVIQNSFAENSNKSQESGSQQNKFVRTNIFKSEYSNQSLNNNNNSNENLQKPIFENKLEKKSSENTPSLKKQVSQLKNMFNFCKKQTSDSSLQAQEKNDEIQNQNQSQKMEEEEEQVEEKKVKQNNQEQKKKSKIQIDSDDDILSATSNFTASEQEEEEKPKKRRGRQSKIQLLKKNKQEKQEEEEIRPLRSTTRSKNNTKSKKQENEAILIDSGKQSKKSTNSVQEVSADDFDASQVQIKNKNNNNYIKNTNNNNLSNEKQNNNNNNNQQQQKKQISFLSKFGGAKGALKPSTGGLQRATNNFDVEDEILKISFSNFSPTESDLRRLKYYGAQVVDDKYQHFDLLVIDESKRTIKLLIALLNNVPIVSQQWIQACLKQKKLVNDYENYIPKTTQDFKEKFDIDMKEIFQERQSIKDLEIFAGYKFFVSPKMDESEIQIEELNYLIELGGGEIVKKQPNKTSAKNKKLICIIGKNEQQLYHTLAKAKLQISDFEIILNSALYSNFDIQENLIDDDFFK